jgi:UDP-glucose 4-epimerase
MGMTKALMEKVAQSFVRNYPESNTRIAITRYGNVMMSRGSVIPHFLNQIRQGKPLTVTDPLMTRFMMSLDDSVSLVKYAFTNANSGDLFVRKAPACSVETLATAVTRLLKLEGKIKIKRIGTRHGEKLFESLLGTEECSRAIDRGDYYQVPLDTRSLDYQAFFNIGRNQIPSTIGYTSHNTHQLSVNEVVELLSGLPEFQNYRKANLK